VLGFGSKDDINNDHVHNNPAEAGLVEEAEDYLYSSAEIMFVLALSPSGSFKI
jgi:hypothetical protein